MLRPLQSIECNRPLAVAIPSFMAYCTDVVDCGESQNLGYCNQDLGQCCCYDENSGEKSRLHSNFSQNGHFMRFLNKHIWQISLNMFVLFPSQIVHVNQYHLLQ